MLLHFEKLGVHCLYLLTHLSLDADDPLGQVNVGLSPVQMLISIRLKRLIKSFDLSRIVLHLHMRCLQDLSHLVKQLFCVLFENSKLDFKVVFRYRHSDVLRNWFACPHVLKLIQHLGAFLFTVCLIEPKFLNPVFKSSNFSVHFESKCALQFIDLVTDCVCKCSKRLFENTRLRLERFNSRLARRDLTGQVCLWFDVLLVNSDLLVLQRLHGIVQLEDLFAKRESLGTFPDL